MRLLFLDESGYTHNWKENVDQQRFHVLGGVLVESAQYFALCAHVRAELAKLPLEVKAPPLGQGFEIKAREIARGHGWWRHNEPQRNAVRDLMLRAPGGFGAVGFVVVIDKKLHLEKYPLPDPPHEIALRYLLERAQWKLKDLNEHCVGVYDQAKVLDDEVHEASADILREGSSWVREGMYGYYKAELKMENLHELYLGRSDNSLGLQFADYLATFAYQHFKNGRPADCGWWKTLEAGLYTKDKKLEGFGLKVFP
jgi:hypothetical protein